MDPRLLLYKVLRGEVVPDGKSYPRSPNKANNHDPLEKRFWDRVDKRGPDECWEWQGARVTHGYGAINVSGKQYGAHVVSWWLHYGGTPAGISVLHKCDNPPCVNPAHLFLGTHQENMADMKRKGRARNKFTREKG